MKRLSSLIFFLVLGVATAWAQPTLEMSRRAEAKPRNVIFILSDDHRFDYMGFTGKVPFLMRYPEALAGGQVIEKMVQNIDVAPTVLEVAGINQPEQMQGRSMVPILKGEETDWHDRIFYEYYWEYAFPQTPTMHGVRTDRYK